jgi:hypothetical protein
MDIPPLFPDAPGRPLQAMICPADRSRYYCSYNIAGISRVVFDISGKSFDNSRQFKPNTLALK